MQDPGYSDGVAIIHGVLRQPNKKERARDTVKFYLTPYWIENDYEEHMPAVPRCMPSEEEFNAPDKWGEEIPTLSDGPQKNAMWELISLGSWVLNYPEAYAALNRFFENTGETLHVSAQKFYREAADFQTLVDKNVMRLELITGNEIRAGRTGNFSMITNLWRQSSIGDPENWRGIYRGYEYYVSGLYSGGTLTINVTVFKQYNFDLTEEYGDIFTAIGATGNKLNDFYQKGLACNIHIWSRMTKTCKIDISTGNMVNTSSWKDDSSTSSLKGYRTNYR
jgi:hypothetical protein